MLIALFVAGCGEPELDERTPEARPVPAEPRVWADCSCDALMEHPDEPDEVIEATYEISICEPADEPQAFRMVDCSGHFEELGYVNIVCQCVCPATDDPC